MKNIYIYPTYTPSRDKSGNLYIKLFHDAFKNHNDWKVKNRCWKIGISSLFANLDADVFVIHWVDLIPFKRGGKIQFLLFLLGILVLKVLRKRIIWILHNKRSHRGPSRWVDMGMAYLAKMADRVIVHAKNGIDFFEMKYPSCKGKCTYIPHPVYSSEICKAGVKRWDYIIWGAVGERKYIAEFLEYIKSDYFFSDKKILICGKCSDKQYAERITKACSVNVTFENEFLSDAELHERIIQSRCILFTYNTDSVLSSGALVYSLNFCVPIIGPRAGSFVDLDGIVACYDTFEDIKHIHLTDVSEQCLNYIKENIWEKFPKKLAGTSL